MKKELGLIQIRTGKQRNVPNSLELGELALTTDEGRMFVGLPSVVIPVSPVSGRTAYSLDNCTGENVEILTEFSPNAVVNRVLNRSTKTTIPVNKKATINLSGASRLELNIYAYTNAALVPGTTIVDSTAILQVKYANINSKETYMVQYTDSNGNANAIYNSVIAISQFSYTSGIVSFSLGNNSGLPLTIEYNYRAWDDATDTASAVLTDYTPTQTQQ